VALAGASAAVTSAVVGPAVGPDFHLEDLTILGAGELLEGRAAAGALPLPVIGQFDDLLEGGRVRVVAARGGGLAGLLPRGLWVWFLAWGCWASPGVGWLSPFLPKSCCSRRRSRAREDSFSASSPGWRASANWCMRLQ
jgi:hypothetical protein